MEGCMSFRFGLDKTAKIKNFAPARHRNLIVKPMAVEVTKLLIIV
jgi:hypothetical protein